MARKIWRKKDDGSMQQELWSQSSIENLPSTLNGKLDKTTYEASKELACGSNGKVCLGKFGAYDTNITIELNSTTSTTYHATIVIHSQNVAISSTAGSVGCNVYGDADNHITPLLTVFRPYGSASRQIEVYANLPGWSKNLVHIQAVALADGGMTDVLTSVSSIPTSISGKTKVTPVNVIKTNTVSQVNVGGTAYTQSNGVVSLPAYPSTSNLPASSITSGTFNASLLPYAVKSTSSSTTAGTKGAVRIRVYNGNLYIHTS